MSLSSLWIDLLVENDPVESSRGMETCLKLRFRLGMVVSSSSDRISISMLKLERYELDIALVLVSSVFIR